MKLIRFLLLLTAFVLLAITVFGTKIGTVQQNPEVDMQNAHLISHQKI
jgi:hypothetical protein